jgi:hypothetical protein
MPDLIIDRFRRVDLPVNAKSLFFRPAGSAEKVILYFVKGQFKPGAGIVAALASGTRAVDDWLFINPHVKNVHGT